MHAQINTDGCNCMQVVHFVSILYVFLKSIIESYNHTFGIIILEVVCGAASALTL